MRDKPWTLGGDLFVNMRWSPWLDRSRPENRQPHGKIHLPAVGVNWLDNRLCLVTYAPGSRRIHIVLSFERSRWGRSRSICGVHGHEKRAFSAGEKYNVCGRCIDAAVELQTREGCLP